MRSRPVEQPHFLEYQVTLLLSIAAAGLTVLWMRGNDLSFLVMDYRTWPREPWRLLTATLLHAGYLHLIFNLYWTWRFGSILEPIFGHVRMIGIYLLLGAGSSAAQWAFSGPGVGLSGIGYGLFGLSWALDRRHPSYRGVLDPGTTRAFVVWFFLCIAATFTNLMPIANEAHGAGALFGGLLGLSLSPLPRWRLRGRVGLVLATVVVGLGCTVLRPYVNYSRTRAYELFYDGTVALQQAEFETAARCNEASVARDPDFREAWHNLGVAYARLGRVAEARRAMARAEELEATAAQRPAERTLLAPLFDLGREKKDGDR
jgi:membrane associated rhomboid family serine protease